MDTAVIRQVPYSLEAEQSVLGAILLDARCINDIISVVRADDFYLTQNKDIFETIYYMFNHGDAIDPVTVLAAMRQRGVFDESTSTNYIMQLMEITPTAANAERYAAIVAEKATQRRLLSASGDITEMVYEGVGTTEEMLEAAERKIFAVRRDKNTSELEPVSGVLNSVFERLRELSKNTSGIPGIETGFRDLDRKMGGLNKTDLIILAARPGMGKTSIALNIALGAAKKSKKCVAIFSLEMSKLQLAMRLLSTESFVDSNKLSTGRLSNDDWSKIGLAASSLSQTDIRLNDNASITVAEINAICRRVDNLGLVIIDYLQLMQSAGNSSRVSDNRVTVVSEISRALKIMAKELDVPVICLSQLSRTVESRKDDKRPILSDLRESGSIEQDADEVIFLYRDDYYNDASEEPGVAEIILAKNRHGETATVKVQWLAQYTAFADREWVHDEY